MYTRETEDYLLLAEGESGLRAACLQLASELALVEARAIALRGAAVRAQLAETDAGYAQHLNEGRSRSNGLCEEVGKLLSLAQRVVSVEDGIRAHAQRTRASYQELEKQRAEVR
jgi:hypothetical protein